MDTLALSNDESLATHYPVVAKEVSDALQEANKQLAYVSKAAKIFNRPHSDKQWDAFVYNHDSYTRNISQMSAQLKEKRDALTEAKCEYRIRLAKIEKSLSDADRCENTADRNIHLAEAKKWEAYSVMMHEGIMGAVKDIAQAATRYRQMEVLIEAKHGRPLDEKMFEEEEKEYWPKRIIRQSLRDVRTQGHITAGNQEALENYGLDPLAIQVEISEYLRVSLVSILDGSGASTESLDSFIDGCGEKYKNVHDEKLALYNDCKPKNLFVGSTDDT